MIRSPLWGVGQARVGLLTSVWWGMIAQEAVSLGQWEINWHRRCEDRPEFWRVDKWSKELAFTEYNNLELWLQIRMDRGSNPGSGTSCCVISNK